MSKRSKKSYSAKLKFQVVLEALTSDKGDAEIAYDRDFKSKLKHCVAPTVGGS